jgi:hypothetical protein
MRFAGLALSPDIIAVHTNAAKDRLRVDGDRRRLMHAKLEFASQVPPFPTVVRRDVSAGIIERDCKEISITTLE